MQLDTLTGGLLYSNQTPACKDEDKKKSLQQHAVDTTRVQWEFGAYMGGDLSHMPLVRPSLLSWLNWA